LARFRELLVVSFEFGEVGWSFPLQVSHR
jgi:hypothetical protein